ncbi:hypothetical protein W97_06125 [Coniosporium apollinis CBS 100218]|uniref:Transcription factor Nrm1/Whi5 n=1 Tax=Coniosporium apollinis (strain CBS 100218) TaxID=1168221 RepID=R7YYY9_CONA1|nr:uncharacterized protein W97_06125 [Coniosporium apollinis CBS 100218]EON67009.1 hypothetical protein W97_06125 [Coniosporium apollinis CBS 100218]
MPPTEPPSQPAEVATKVLRRAEVSKATRILSSRLALANVKIKHGWENLSLDSIEPRVEQELKRKRPGGSSTLSDTSSITSQRYYAPGVLDSSPLAKPIFSDDLGRPGSYKRTRFSQPASSNHARRKVRTSMGSTSSWKSQYHLPASSPAYHQRHASYQVAHVPSLSFVSETSTIPDDPASPLLSEDDDTDLPVHSFAVGTSANRIHSPTPTRSPRTPPPGLARSGRLRNDAFTAASRNRHNGEEGVDLLMYLAASPSPAQAAKTSTRVFPPSTPPPKSTPLPSSMMTTPGGGIGAPFSGFGLNTPSANFNFAEFVNMTPSPAQGGGSWGRTPSTARTPLAAREARRRLNFDSLLPPSPGVGMFERTSPAKGAGLGMELGGELVS